METNCKMLPTGRLVDVFFFFRGKQNITKGELWQVDESLTVAVGSVEGKWLHHVVSLQLGLLYSLLHHLNSLHTGHGVKVAVDSYDLGPWSAMGK